MNAPRFWWGKSYGIIGMLARLIAFGYALVAKKRMQQEPKYEAKIPVVCVGNFVVGGAGKTPFCIALFKLLKEKGFTPVFLTRGYGGQQREPIQVEIQHHDANQVGDEALLLAKVGSTVVAEDRGKGAELATQIGGDIIIMDDGFQNPNLKKDVAIVLIDSKFGIGNSRCLPAGPLRAPLDVQIQKTDILVVIGDGERADEVIQNCSQHGITTLHAEIKPINIGQLKDVAILAFAGIGHPQKFFDTLKEKSLNVIHEIGFPDHHVFKSGEIRDMLNIAEQESLTLVTTAKDYARLLGIDNEHAVKLREQTKVLEVEMELVDSQTFVSKLVDLLGTKITK